MPLSPSLRFVTALIIVTVLSGCEPAPKYANDPEAAAIEFRDTQRIGGEVESVADGVVHLHDKYGRTWEFRDAGLYSNEIEPVDPKKEAARSAVGDAAGIVGLVICGLLLLPCI